MNDVLNGKKSLTDTPEEEKTSGEKINNSADASQDVETEKNMKKEDKIMSNTAKKLQESPGQEKEENQPIFIGIEENFSENVDFITLGVDTTPVNVVATGKLELGNTDPGNLDQWFKSTETTKDLKEEDIAKCIEDGLKISSGMIVESNRIRNLAGKTIAEKALIIGSVCNRLQNLRKGIKNAEPWGIWADVNIPLGIRTRQKYMQVADEPDCYEFPYLGVDKMAMLCSITKGVTVKGNKIKWMLKKYKIPSDPDNTITMDDFKQRIEAMIGVEKLVKKGYRIPFDLALEAVEAGVKLNDSLLKEFGIVKGGEGSPAKHLKKLINGNGDNSGEKDPEATIKDFNSSAEQLIKSVFYVLETVADPENEEYIKTLDKPIFDELIKQLEALKAQMPSEK
jgi:hypothetical protein